MITIEDINIGSYVRLRNDAEAKIDSIHKDKIIMGHINLFDEYIDTIDWNIDLTHSWDKSLDIMEVIRK